MKLQLKVMQNINITFIEISVICKSKAIGGKSCLSSHSQSSIHNKQVDQSQSLGNLLQKEHLFHQICAKRYLLFLLMWEPLKFQSQDKNKR